MPANDEGFIYFIASFPGRDGHNLVKIGFTGNVHKRLETFRTALPFDPELAFSMPGTMADEKEIHRRLAESRFNREWFHYDDRVQAMIDDLVDAATLLKLEHGDDFLVTAGDCLEYEAPGAAFTAMMAAGLAAETATREPEGDANG